MAENKWGKVSTTGQGYLTANAKTAYSYFVSLGYTYQQAAGIVGNLIAESGLDPTISQRGGPGRGIAQWSAGARWESLKAWADRNKLNPFALTTQLAFIDHELRTSEKSAGNALKKTTTVADASLVFEKQYERPAAGSTVSRKNNSEYIYTLFRNQRLGVVADATVANDKAQAEANTPVNQVLRGENPFGGGVLSDLGSITKNFGDPSFWLRIGFIVFGFLLLLLVLAKVANVPVTPAV